MSSTAVLVADLVESTALSTRLGDDAFERVLQEHDEVVADVITGTHGRLVKFLGDGFIAAFASASDALDCAEAFQQMTSRLSEVAGEPVRARVGVSLGDVFEREGDLHGRAMVEAARLCAAAPNGTILCTEVTYRAASGRPEDMFGPLQHLDLKGLPTLEARELRWQPAVGTRRAGLVIETLGGLRASRHGAPLELGGPKEHRVLAVLTASANQAVSVDSIVDALWGEDPPRTAARSVHAYVARLRRAIEPARRAGAGPKVLVTENRSYRLVLDRAAIDACRFEDLVERGRASLAAGRSGDAVESLSDALGLWHGTPYDQHLDVERCAVECRRLEALHGLALEEQVAARLELGGAGDLVPEIEGLVSQYPLRERLWCFLLVALYRAGRQGDALDAYQRARSTLIEELGVEPGPELRHLEAAILAHDPTLLAPSRSTGVRHDLPAQLDPGGAILAGRDAELGVLRRAWERARDGEGGFVAVAGREGVGKTRLAAELAREVHDRDGIVAYAVSDTSDRGARSLFGRALRAAGGEAPDLGVDFDRAPGAALARLLPTWAEGRTVLLVLENLDRADPETIAAIADLAEWSTSLQLLVVGTFRSDDAFESGGGDSSRLVLGSLSHDAIAEIAALYAETWTTGEIQSLASASGGVPATAHRLAGEWAREAGLRRVDAAAAQAAAARLRLTVTRDDLAHGVAELQRLLERRRDQLPARPADDAGHQLPPYRGLESFGTSDAEVYFGREHLVAELVASVATTPFVAVIGPSGSGKSSLAKAGLVPALASGVLPGSESWKVATVVPGAHPLGALRAAQTAVASGEPTLVVVDPLEELWTACRDERERLGFADRLLEFVEHRDVVVVACIRSDFMGRIAEHPGLAAAIGIGTLLVSEMTSDELRRAVEGPARRRGLEVESALVDTAVREVAGRPGALPLLSTALLATWERRTGPVLTLASYREAGGVASALAGLADGCYDALEPEAREAARRILLRLASDEGGTDVRVRSPVAALATGPEAVEALDALVQRRLVTVDGDDAEIAHEALLREWPRLREWLQEDREGRRVRRGLAHATQEWVASDCSDDLLFRGTRLVSALDAAGARPSEINPPEREFLGASRARQEAELRSAQRTAHRFRRLTVGMAAVLVVALVAVGFSLVQRSRATENADRAQAEATVSEARRLAAESRATGAGRVDLALLLALAARQVRQSPETNGALENALLSVPPGVERVFDFGARRYWTVDRSIKNRIVVPAGRPGALALLDPATGKVVRELAGWTGDGGGVGPAVSRDGRWASAGTPGGTIYAWDAATGRRIGRFDTGGGGPAYGGFDPTDTNRLIVAGHDGRVVVWHLDDPAAPPVELSRAPASTSSQFPDLVRLSADGTQVAVGDPIAGPTHILDAHTGALRRILPGTAGDFSADGSVVLTSTAEGVRRWNLSTGTQVGPTMAGLPKPGPLATFSPNGRYVAVGDLSDQHAYVFAVDGDGQAIFTVEARNAIPLPNWRRDGLLTVQGFYGAIVARVDRGGLPPLALPLGGSGRPAVALATNRADRLVTLDAGEGTRTIDAESGAPIARIPHPGGTSDAFVLPSPNLRFMATVGAQTGPGYAITVWERGRSKPLGAVDKAPDDPPDWYWTRDSKTLVVVHKKTVDLWKPRHGSLRRYAQLHPVGPYAPPPTGTIVAFSPNGRTVAVARENVGTATFFDVASGRRKGAYRLGKGLSMSAMAYSPDGHTLAVAATPLPRAARSSVLMLDPTTRHVRARSELPAIVDQVFFLHDAAMFVTLTDSDTGLAEMSLWDSKTFTRIGEPLEGPAARNSGMDVAPGGRRVTMSTDKGALAWDVDPQSWVKRACAIAGRTLTRGEWKRYLPGRPYDPPCRV